MMDEWVNVGKEGGRGVCGDVRLRQHEWPAHISDGTLFLEFFLCFLTLF